MTGGSSLPRLVALLGGFALVASACASTASGESADPSATATGTDAADWVDAFEIDPWEDGLNRVVVRWDPDAVPADGMTPSGLRSVVDSDTFEPVDPDHPLAGTPGEFPPPVVEPETTLPPTTVAPTTTAPTALIELGAPDESHDLLEEPGVVEVVPLGDGLYQVAGSMEVDELLELPGVQEGWPEMVAGISDDPRRPEQWYLVNDGGPVRGQPGAENADVDAPESWDRSDGSGVVVAVIDTGVDIDHPDLVGNLWTNPGEVCGNGVDDDGNGYTDDCNGWDFAERDASMTDTNGHGTHIAGTIAAVTDNDQGIAGIAPGARIMPVRISTGPSFGLAVTVPAIDYAVANGADVLNLSWGTRPGTPVGAYPPLEAAIERARQAGVMVMIAAGNSGVNIDSATVIPASYPHENVITVGASTNADQRASFSNFGPRTVEVFAPGHHIMATLPGGGYGYQSGTSMATPVAAGVAAMLRSAAPVASVTELREALITGSTPVDTLAGFSVSGGRLHTPSSLIQVAPGVSFELTGLSGLEPDQAASIGISSIVDPSSGLSAAGAGVRGTLLTEHQGAIRTVTQHGLTVDGAETLTDDDGRFTGTQRGGPPSLALTTELPAGTYGLLLELVDGDGERIGEAGLVGFAVTATVEEPPSTEAPSTPTTEAPAGGGAPTAPTTTTPSSGGGDGGTPSTPTDPDAPTVTTIPTAPPADGTPTPTTTPSSGGGDGGTPSTPTDPGSGGGGGGGTPTSPTTTVPSTGGTPGSPTTTTPTTVAPPSSGPISSGDIEITAISPSSGSVGGGDLVTITGSDLGERPTVLFGDRAGTVVVNVAGVQLLVLSPTSPAGPVDVTVVDGSRRGVVSGGFTFVEPGGSSPGDDILPTTTTPGTATPPSGGSPGGGSPTPTPTPSPAPTTTTPVPTPAPGDGGSAPTTTEPAVVEGPGGLQLGRLPADIEALGLVPGDLGRADCGGDPCTTQPRSS
ncbi:MAG: S8 family serine peptidase [Actinomycetota bacterium]